MAIKLKAIVLLVCTFGHKLPWYLINQSNILLKIVLKGRDTRNLTVCWIEHGDRLTHQIPLAWLKSIRKCNNRSLINLYLFLIRAYAKASDSTCEAFEMWWTRNKLIWCRNEITANWAYFYYKGELPQNQAYRPTLSS